MTPGGGTGECSNSAAVIHRQYRELVKPADAERWFSIRQDSPANLVTRSAAATA
ncbi:MAG: hypothetical protein HYY24_06715 [Verrucomicrobia bacterium]|nr:hypothetical protein [Verrucomicrobiota bacterium]